MIRRYDAMVVPSITDEQPRIVFDAYSLAVPVLDSDTPGLRSCVKSGEVGLFVPPNDVSSLSGLLKYAAEHRSELRQPAIANICSQYDAPGDASTTRTLLQAMMDTRKQARRS